MNATASTSPQRAEPGDGELLRGEDANAFRVFFDRHVGPVHGFLVLRVGPDAADDLTSEAFAIAWDRRTSYRADAGPARSWLYGIAANVVRRHRVAEARWAASVAAEWAVRDTGAAFADAVGDADPALLAAVAKLPPSERDVLLLVASSGMPVADAAQHLGVSTVAARVRLHRARRKLTTELQEGTS